MVSRTLAVAFAFVALTGCASKTYWTNYPAPRDPEAYQRVAYECQRDAAMVPRTPQSVARGPGGVMVYSDPSHGLFDVAAQNQMYEACMRSRGYRPVSE